MAGLRAPHNLMIINDRNSGNYTLGLSPTALYYKIYRDNKSPLPTLAYGDPYWGANDWVLFEISSEFLYESILEQDVELVYSVIVKDVNDVTHVLAEGSVIHQQNKKLFSPLNLTSFVARNYVNSYFEIDTIDQRNIVTKNLQVNIDTPNNLTLLKRIKTIVKGTYLGTKNGSVFSYNP